MMPIHHVTYAIPNAKKCIKESYTYATKKLPHTNSRNKTHTKLPPANE
jgi:hypothetical protein